MAYVNATINEGSRGSFQVDVTGALSLYQRVKFSTVASPGDNSGKPTLIASGATDRAIAVVMQPGAVGAFINVRFLNAEGEQVGIASGGITLGALVYQGAAGVLTATAGGGALVAGVATTPGFDGGAFTYMPQPAAA